MRYLILSSIICILSACSFSPTAQTPPTSVPTVIPTVVVAEPSRPEPLPTVLADSEWALVERARSALLEQSAVDDDTLQFQRIHPNTWPTSALGCPAPDQLYTQVLTSGFLIVFGDITRTYEIHTTDDGGPLVWCDTGTPKPIGSGQTG